ncbi:oxidoreductase [Niastella koreensis]|uniref:Oxidoreductase domain protein n=2 Tax=Niastella koreensis TaxID=354356 RepID=G8TK34_NIAKG|nr:Gfo/Idh/MocA family oxidoreductase [Niastella koreensis]AEW02972.1 oxidoreductase domain protein [Niastella koreensis GR20-10]OQP55287.1 oxidoreductase [Niastella koreensis]
MTLNGKIKFAVVGCGHIGKRHAAMISNNPEAELVALADVKETIAKDVASYNVPFFTSLTQLLESEIPFDVLCVATPNGLHEEQALQALRAGRNVVIEKPMALTKAGCERIIYEALHHHRQVFCVMQNRYSPPMTWLKEVLRKNLLGNIYLVQVNCYWNRDERYYVPGNWHGTKNLDGGVLYTQFSHFIDIMFWLFGDIENIKGKFTNFNHKQLTEFDDSGFVNFDFVNGGMGCINFSTSAWNENLESSITIIGENGTVKVGGQYMNELQVCKIKNYEMPVLPPGNPPNDYGPYKGSAANHHYVFQNVVDVLKGRAAITTNALEGLKVVEIIQKIYNNNHQSA